MSLSAPPSEHALSRKQKLRRATDGYKQDDYDGREKDEVEA